MALPGADDPDGVVWAVLTDGDEVVATGAVAPEQPPAELDGALPQGRRWRLRSMATRPDLRSSGLGAAVVAALIEHVGERGGGIIWCRARIPAVPFYERAGFETSGESWVEEKIGPHIMMWRAVQKAEGEP